MMIQFLQIAKDSVNVAKEIETVESVIKSGHADLIIDKLVELSISAGKNILMAVVVYIVGRFLISLIQKLLANMLSRRKVEISIQTFLKSMVNILLNVLLIISVVGALGVSTTSFAALLASAGVAIGMALSGNLQNFAGGTAIQIMHTIVTTADNKVVYIPNGAMSSGVITKYSRMETRRVDWTVGVAYGADIDKVTRIVEGLIDADSRILHEPAPVIALQALDASSVNVTIRVWVPNAEYWNVYFEMNKKIYDEFNKQGIDFPFPQLTIHQA